MFDIYLYLKIIRIQIYTYSLDLAREPWILTFPTISFSLNISSDLICKYSSEN